MKVRVRRGEDRRREEKVGVIINGKEKMNKVGGWGLFNER